MGNELVGSPRRPANMADIDARALDLGQELADYKHRLDAMTLDLEAANRDITRLEVSIENRDQQIARLESRLTQSLMRNAEQATHIVQLHKITTMAVGGLEKSATIHQEHVEETAQIAADRSETPRPN